MRPLTAFDPTFLYVAAETSLFSIFSTPHMSEKQVELSKVARTSATRSEPENAGLETEIVIFSGCKLEPVGGEAIK